MAQDPKVDVAEDAVAVAATKKKLIIIVAAVVLLAGGSGLGWFLMQKNTGHKKQEVKREEPARAPVFLSMEDFTVNLQADPDEKFLQLNLSLQLPSPEAAEAVKVHMPVVRSRILLLLTSKNATEISTIEGKQQLTDEIITEVKKPFAAGSKPQEVLGVFFNSFVIQ